MMASGEKVPEHRDMPRPNGGEKDEKPPSCKGGSKWKMKKKSEELKEKVEDDGKDMVQWMASALKAVHMAELSGKARARATNAVIRASRADTANNSEQEGSQTELLNSVCGDVVDRTFSILPDLLSKSVDAHLDRLRRNVALHNFDAMQVAEMAPQKLNEVQRSEGEGWERWGRHKW